MRRMFHVIAISKEARLADGLGMNEEGDFAHQGLPSYKDAAEGTPWAYGDANLLASPHFTLWVLR